MNPTNAIPFTTPSESSLWKRKAELAQEAAQKWKEELDKRNDQSAECAKLRSALQNERMDHADTKAKLEGMQEWRFAAILGLLAAAVEFVILMLL